ncbi:tetrapyrrole methylase [Conidiobolus coronatus NRRL 28638]|uniref:Tetrapyrrole methylase n=1 Tax=Conidiobolus coronatus (strain ATCC 28846 / CBS 209.66 / NRRL 28638) TaxID=796925 RepID=A0A137P6F8_CONC2|nr:tetrapyrrole methylase [Conidiobolus coronatus NRRL 28638]|eukprot:KXN70501.1 tetrapyrrole methylase [Conidiobolus coronatus NRRL 28638]
MSDSKYSRVEGGGSLILAWQIKDKRVLVIGGGYEASSRIRSSLQADAKVTVVCPKAEVNEEVQFRIDGKEVEYLDRDFIPEDLEGVDMCLSTDQPPEVGALIYDLCKQRGIPVNVADDIPKCDFWFMSNYKDKALQLAISSNGKAPRLAKNLRKKISESLPKNVGLAMENFGRVREAIQKADPGHESAPKRMKWCCDLCDLWSYDQLAKVDDTIIEQLVNNYRDSQVPSFSSLVESKGSIIIVGAGPGNPDLLTVAGAQALQEAELVVSDRLVSPKVLDLVGGELRIAPKKLIGSSDPIQQQLNDWVIEGAKAGKKVVRLKEGDPFVFGRVGEEIEHYKQHGYKPISIPGISSSISCAHSSLIPVTHRGVSDKLMC